jgi:hypothetical protein
MTIDRLPSKGEWEGRTYDRRPPPQVVAPYLDGLTDQAAAGAARGAARWPAGLAVPLPQDSR